MTVKESIISVKVRCEECGRISDVPFEDFEICLFEALGEPYINQYLFMCQYSDCDTENVTDEEFHEIL